jgi:hypothetical protein
MCSIRKPISSLLPLSHRGTAKIFKNITNRIPQRGRVAGYVALGDSNAAGVAAGRPTESRIVRVYFREMYVSITEKLYASITEK